MDLKFDLFCFFVCHNIINHKKYERNIYEISFTINASGSKLSDRD